MLLLMDFEEAFNSVNFGFIVTTMDIFCFGEEFIKWINKIIKSCDCCTKPRCEIFKGIAQLKIIHPWLGK